MNNCSLILIKSHILSEKKLGCVLDFISNSGLLIDGINLFNLDKGLATELLEVYKEVLPEYLQMIEEITTGYCVAVEVYDNNNDNIVQRVREICGPHDPQIAKVLRPNTIRSNFGNNRVKNAVHCTDLFCLLYTSPSPRD